MLFSPSEKKWCIGFLKKKSRRKLMNLCCLCFQKYCVVWRKDYTFSIHTTSCANICASIFKIFFISHCFPPSLYVSTSQQKASQACHWHQLARSGCTGQITKWPLRHCRGPFTYIFSKTSPDFSCVGCG